MHQVFFYADSLSWGIVPGPGKRFAFTDRWAAVLEREPLRQWQIVRIIEDCLYASRTVLDDPLKPGCNGLVELEQRIEANAPLSLVMILLGTNDFDAEHQFAPADCADGVILLVGAIRKSPIEPGVSRPEIMLIAPPEIQDAKAVIAPKFRGTKAKAVGLNLAIQEATA